ncbi:tetratricopeptide repeat protein [Salipiger sp. IMCC34102]|uniref:tetratricopeptide repeat protein n=1 Tax=Salipiger sp. IMCC34102 TaxID=2510647 RepID=UPI00101CCEE5|nr:tetratricopeptide repeat protein [Salipiger sp. IMCC34102]RYH01143.1 tetratricopeptide repeat protein [Salipiger sp. IMCC34102]
MTRGRSVLWFALLLAACGPPSFETDGVFAPGIAGEATTDGLETGHRLMASGNYELALRAYTRAAAQQGLNVDTLSALGSANLRLGRLGQAEELLRRAVREDPGFSPAWNNLGVLLMERREYGEAAEVFRRAFATDNGNSDRIRANLALALAKRDDALFVDDQQDQLDLVVMGAGETVDPL